MKCKIDEKVYQDDTNLLKVQHGNSFANLHMCPKLGLLHISYTLVRQKPLYGLVNAFGVHGTYIFVGWKPLYGYMEVFSSESNPVRMIWNGWESGFLTSPLGLTMRNSLDTF